jgi:hypothetical protein
MSKDVSLCIEVKRRMNALLTGEKSRGEVADWAMRWVRDDSLEVNDSATWRALDELVGADLMIGPAEYLHNEDDFHNWIQVLERAIEDGTQK